MINLPKKHRADKKFMVKVWVNSNTKSNFKALCISKHMSMSDLGSLMVIEAIDNFAEKRIEDALEERLKGYNRLNFSKEGYEIIAILLTDKHWQKLGNYAVIFNTSVAKVGTALFNYFLQTDEMRRLWSKD
ncbi:MAG TPA: hypothetical protein VK190_05015 [Pseudoneobacillus sp.]|nr:hypothetical protein [Pseudoneobacillus sp.]